MDYMGKHEHDWSDVLLVIQNYKGLAEHNFLADIDRLKERGMLEFRETLEHAKQTLAGPMWREFYGQVANVSYQIRACYGIDDLNDFLCGRFNEQSQVNEDWYWDFNAEISSQSALEIVQNEVVKGLEKIDGDFSPDVYQKVMVELGMISVVRERSSVTQGEVSVQCCGEVIMRYGDDIQLANGRTLLEKDLYGPVIDGWGSVKPDHAFIRAALEQNHKKIVNVLHGQAKLSLSSQIEGAEQISSQGQKFVGQQLFRNDDIHDR